MSEGPAEPRLGTKAWFFWPVLFLFAFFLVAETHGEDPRLTALVRQGDAEEKLGRTRAALGFFRSAEQLDPRHVGVLLRISKQYSDLIATTKPRAAAEQIAQKSLLYAQRAVALDGNTAKGHLSVAVAYGRLTDFAGNKEKLEYSKIIKTEAQKSIDLDPGDDYAWHVLGRWHAGVANVNGALKLMAKLAYGGLPAASNEEAVRYLKRAAELAPQRMIHRSELARVYQLSGKKELAEKEWRTVLAMTPTDKEDEKDQTEARAILTPGKVVPPAAPTSGGSSATAASRGEER